MAGTNLTADRTTSMASFGLFPITSLVDTDGVAAAARRTSQSADPHVVLTGDKHR